MHSSYRGIAINAERQGQRIDKYSSSGYVSLTEIPQVAPLSRQ